MHTLFLRGLMFISILIAVNCQAQQYVMIKGQVWDLTGQKLVGAYAYNQTRHYGTFTNIDGMFFLVMNPGDSLKVSMIGFKPYKIKIPKNLSSDAYKLDVTLATDTILLKTTEIKPYPATYAELKKQFVKLKVPEEKLRDRLLMPNVLYRSKYSNPDGGGLVLPGPFSLLYNAFSKEGKELKKMNVILEKNRIRDKLLEIISRETLEKEFHLKTDDEIDDMINKCGITEEMLSKNTGYSIVKHIINCLK